MSTGARHLIIWAIFAALLLAACGAEAPSPTTTPVPQSSPTPQPVLSTPEPPTREPPSIDDWYRVQEAGQIIVGTSADYPPFAYYTENFMLDGFDLALMREIGNLLGVKVVVKDFAFDGLLSALQLGQVDAAIAAITITDERAEQVDFSRTYYVGQEAVLADGDAPFGSLDDLQDLSNRRVGVQKGSVYESWAEANLVDTGLLPSNALQSFGNVDQAVTALDEGRIELVLMDAVPAQLYVQQGKVKQVASGITRQQFGIAVRKGSTLRGVIDEAIRRLQEEDRIAELVQAYLDLGPHEAPTPEPPTPTPTATPEPPTATPQPASTPTSELTSTPTPEPPCIDGMAWVQDLSLDDRNMTAPPVLQPDQPFIKGWRVRNSGTCPWNSAYFLTYVTGNDPASVMDGQPLPIQGTVAPGEVYDLRLNLVAPTRPGVYQGVWQMRNAEGRAFGERIWVGITVPGLPTPTPVPTQTPAPGIYFSADRTQVRAGEPVSFIWNVRNVQEVYFYEQGQPWQQNGVAGEGNRTVYPQQTTTYELRVVHRDGRIEIRQIRIDVIPVIGAPYIAQFEIYPQGPIRAGQCLDVLWDVQDSTTEVTIGYDNVILWPGAPFRGSIRDCPSQPGTISYYIEAKGPGGTSRSQRTVSVQ